MEKVIKEMPEEVIVEPEVKRHPTSPYLIARQRVLATQAAEPPPPGLGRTITVTARGAGKPLVNANAMLLLSSISGREGGSRIEIKTGPGGEAAFTYNPFIWVPSLLLLEPQSGFWDWWQEQPQADIALELVPLPKAGPIGWWHQAVGMNRYVRDRGEGVRIGVVDSGVGPHPYLPNATSVGAVIDGRYDATPAEGQDVLGHGSHVTGIMIARPVDGSGDYCGIADGAKVFSIRVFPPEGEASQADISEAIDRLVLDHQVDLINLSLGGRQPSQIEQDALRLALDRGTLCIASAGNDFGQPITYPAAHPEAVAVSAIGLAGIYPAGTMAAQSLPGGWDQFGPNNLFLARFSDIGLEMSCGAPGVGIISTVPARPEAAAPYAAYNGTSMAAPVVCASLATVLAQDQIYRGLPRNSERAQWASFVLASCLRPLGLNWAYAGGGLIQAWPS
jgi:hypothetical protein